jgi:hypothetical protein
MAGREHMVCVVSFTARQHRARNLLLYRPLSNLQCAIIGP